MPSRSHPSLDLQRTPRLGRLWLVVMMLGAGLGTSARAAEPTTSTGFEVDTWQMGALPTFDLLDLGTSRVPS
ncbi:MAG: hypothetical protein JNJ59_12135, partial [Deltaproteobacteria bacterium]|nr:hypothetical protein [Deltaproteobacteria bacterium]